MTDEFGAKVDIIYDSKRTIKSKLKIWARRAIMRELGQRCSDQDEEGTIITGRKDVYDVSPYIDQQATMANFSAYKGPKPYASYPELM